MNRVFCFFVAGLLLCSVLRGGELKSEAAIAEAGFRKGIFCVVGAGKSDSKAVGDLLATTDWTVFVVTVDREDAQSLRHSANKEYLGTRLFITTGSTTQIPLADKVADGLWISNKIDLLDEECLRVLRPGGIVQNRSKKLIAAEPEGYDDWSHPFHRADNNPQSNDQVAKGRLRTQFIAAPKFSPMPEQTVIAGGRMYKAMGHIAHKQNQNQHLNTLLCINAYNGTILWQRPLPEGFMIHRNTMIATDDALYLGDHESCKIIDGETGEIREEITIPEEMTDGPTWKWMGIESGILYALLGHSEVKVETQTSDSPGIGHWPWGMWKGHDYEDPENSFGFGRTLIAMDLKSREILWHHRESNYIDARALVMNREKIFYYITEKYLSAVDRVEGKVLWKNSESDLLEAIGPNGRAQHYITGYATSNYMKCSQDYVFFAGPQRKQTVVASAGDGNLLWTNPAGNLQLVLRDDAVYAAGQQGTKGVKLDYPTGKVLAEFPARRACTRATGCADSIFFRASGGTVRVMTDTDSALHIAPMRPPCQDGVLISNGHFYWGPWMCGCQLSLYGNIGLAPAVEVKKSGDALTVFSETKPPKLEVENGDWLSWSGDESRSDTSPVSLPDSIDEKWTVKSAASSILPTAPVAAGGMVFVADRSGAIRAFDHANGQKLWETYADGPIYYPPVIRHDRLYVGSSDGQVWCFAAANGEALWSRRVGPVDRRIPVFGQLVSSWPVAGGVVVKDDTVYAAAGITHYDQTFVVALDAITGEIKAENTTSGVVASEVDNGISLQGNLRIEGGELRFEGGGVYEWARYDLNTLENLNDPKVQVHSDFRTAFYPYYPEYNKYVSLEHTLPDGKELIHYANYEGRYFINLSLRRPRDPEAKSVFKDAAGEFIRRANRSRGVSSKQRDIWRDAEDLRFTSFVVCPNGLLAAGHAGETPDLPFLAFLDIERGEKKWQIDLPSLPVKGGVAIDAKGTIYVSMEDGALRCFTGE